jgi:hypothetical protein
MLNPDHRNLADNFSEFTARASWSYDLRPLLLIFIILSYLGFTCLGLFYSFQFYEQGNFLYSLLTVCGSILILIKFDRFLHYIVVYGVYSLLIYYFIAFSYKLYEIISSQSL